ncbi:MAG: hypothetical protein B6D41_01525, partial [Chloroflexi bacterium UTCFX4]
IYAFDVKKQDLIAPKVMEGDCAKDGEIAIDPASFPSNVFGPGQNFTITVILNNTGSCGWDNEYFLVVSGTIPVDGLTERPLKQTAKENKSEEQITFTTPKVGGKFTNQLSFKYKDDTVFGKSLPLIVDVVLTPTPTSTKRQSITASPTPTLTSTPTSTSSPEITESPSPTQTPTNTVTSLPTVSPTAVPKTVAPSTAASSPIAATGTTTQKTPEPAPNTSTNTPTSTTTPTGTQTPPSPTSPPSDGNVISGFVNGVMRFIDGGDTENQSRRISFLAICILLPLLLLLLALIVSALMRGRRAPSPIKVVSTAPHLTGAAIPNGFTLVNPTVIGTSDRANLPIPAAIAGAASISPEHARIEKRGARWILRDGDAERRQSKTGVFVNDKRTRVNYLQNGDKIRLGDVEFIFHEPPQGAKQ